MKLSILCAFLLLFTSQLYAETYSWVDDTGTYNFTEEYSNIPTQYLKKVQRRGDDPSPEEKTNVVPASEIVPRKPEKSDTRSEVAPEVEKKLYGGKSREEWRREMDGMEAELTGIEKHLEQVRGQIFNPRGISQELLDVLKKDYDDSRVRYNEKYQKYSELIEDVRKAGIQVNITK